MTATVDLIDLIDELEIQEDFRTSYFNRATGAIVRVDDDHFRCAEDDCDLSDYPEEEQAAVRLAGEIFDSEDYIALPTKRDIYEYSIMERFCSSRPDPAEGDRLAATLRGREVFRRFREALRREGLEKAWFAYRHRAFREIAVTWCETHHIPYAG